VFRDKQVQPPDYSGYTELKRGSGITRHNSGDDSYQHVTAKSELISQPVVVEGS
jgi:hypothetical protein